MLNNNFLTLSDSFRGLSSRRLELPADEIFTQVAAPCPTTNDLISGLLADDRLLLKSLNEQNMHLMNALKKLRVNYLKELHVLREEVQTWRVAESEDKERLESRERFFRDFEVHFYDIKDGLVEPDLIEALQISMKQSHRRLIQQIFDLRRRLAEAGLDFPELSPSKIEYTPDTEKGHQNSLKSVHFFNVIEYPQSIFRDYGAWIKPHTTEYGQSFDNFEHIEAAQQTDKRNLLLSSSIALHVEGSDSPLFVRKNLSTRVYNHLAIASQLLRDQSTDTRDDVVNYVQDGMAQTDIGMYISQGSGSDKVQSIDGETQTGLQQPRLARQLTNDEKDLLDEYLRKFRKSFISNLNSNDNQTLHRLLTDGHIQSDDTVFTEITSDSDPEVDGPTGKEEPDSQAMRRRITKLKTELSDMEGKMAVQSKRLHRALHFIDSFKKDRSDAADQAARSMTKLALVKENLRRLRRDLRSRDRQVKHLSIALRNSARRLDRNGGSPDLDVDLPEADDLLFMVTSRSTARMKTFSFEPITSRSNDILVGRRESSESDRVTEFLKTRHQLRLGQLHNLKPLYDDL